MEIFVLEMRPRGEDHGKGPTFINDKTFADRLRKAAELIDENGARNTKDLSDKCDVVIKFINRKKL
tara:strand:+ start:654 stop:851 length:198 start_codon:yes stop_codon:yes gene_type:complete